MNSTILERPFAAMGARVKVVEGTTRLDVRRDRKGEYFDLTLPLEDTQVVNVEVANRHLLLHVEGAKYLLGHDERHWFVAAVHEAEHASTVREAKEALKPREVREVQASLRPKDKNKRRTRAALRQGEWFFVPVPELEVDEKLVLQNEPLFRGGLRGARARAHTLQFCYRRGGRRVYTNSAGAVFTAKQYGELSEEQRKNGHFSVATQDAEVFAMGKVSHRDHATIVLVGWHKVFMNTENRATAMRNVTFLD